MHVYNMALSDFAEARVVLQVCLGFRNTPTQTATRMSDTKKEITWMPVFGNELASTFSRRTGFNRRRRKKTIGTR